MRRLAFILTVVLLSATASQAQDCRDGRCAFPPAYAAPRASYAPPRPVYACGQGRLDAHHGRRPGLVKRLLRALF